METYPCSRAEFPFVAVAGMDLAKEALMLLAIEPGLNGVLIESGPGMGKSMLVRAFRSLLAGISPLPVVEVPLGVTENGLLGSLDLERTLKTGRRHMDEGLLARAHGGYLVINDINLLGRNLIHHLAKAHDIGVVHLERDEVSAEVPSDFSLIGTYNPNEGAVPRLLTESVGILVREGDSSSYHERVDILRRFVAFHDDPLAFTAEYEQTTSRLKERIAGTKRLLPRVEVDRDCYRRLSVAAMRLGVEGHRACIFAVRFARARAAWMGRSFVEKDDLKAAVEFVLLPRAESIPQELAAARTEPAKSQLDPVSTARGSALTAATGLDQPIDDLIIDALDAPLPEGLLTLPNRIDNVAGRSVRRKGDSIEKTDWRRGRYIRAVSKSPKTDRIALAATLRAAAPFQLRGKQSKPDETTIQVAPGDLRFKQFKQKAGILIIFAVDASGSMALNRISQAKGALIRLLQEAYIHRDQVALISFRDDRAELLLPPSRSVESARRALQGLAVGGATPLAAGLTAVLDLARSGQHRDGRRKLLVLFTDGRANAASANGQSTASREVIWKELEIAGCALQDEGVASVVIDTRRPFAASGEAEALAALLGAKYVCLPHTDVAAVHDTVATLTGAMRR